jgi:hypothetical protein
MIAPDLWGVFVMNAFGKSAGGGRRAAPREVTPLLAVYTTVTKSHSALLVDVSSAGARLRSPDLPHESDDVLVILSSVKAFGTVAWAREGEFAISFDEPLQTDDLDVLKRIVASGRGFTPHVKAAIDDWILGTAD